MRGPPDVEWSDTNSDLELRLAARRAVSDCLRLRPGERFVVVFDAALSALAEAMAGEGRLAGASVTSIELGTAAVEQKLALALGDCDVSAFVASYGAPLSVRRQMVDVRGKRRHAHMIGLTPTVIRQSLAADPDEMATLGAKIIGRMQPTSRLRVTSPSGTSLRVATSPSSRWHTEHGIVDRPGWTNLPAGEVITTPASVDGCFVPDGGVWLTDGSELDRTTATRLQLFFEVGRLVGVEGPPDTARALRAHLDDGTHGYRVGQVTFGINAGVIAPIGVSCQDVKLRGFHLILGYSAPELTGADWNGTRLVQLLQRRADVWIDDERVMQGGRYTLA